MKNGNFINVFLVKACSIKLRRGKVHGYGGKGRFWSKHDFVFLRDIHIFFLVLNIVLDQGSFFGSSFFLLLQRYVSKNSGKKNSRIRRLSRYTAHVSTVRSNDHSHDFPLNIDRIRKLLFI